MNPFIVESVANTNQDRPQIRSTTFNIETPPSPRFLDQAHTRSSSFTAAVAAAAVIAATPSISSKIQKAPAMSSSQRRSSNDGLPTNSNKSTSYSKTSSTSKSNTITNTNINFPNSITNTNNIPSSVPDPASAFPNSDPLVGMVNYSPKHSRKRSSLTMNRNMKNLSLNLGVNHSNSSSVDSNSSSYTYNAVSPSKSLPFIPPSSIGSSSQRSLPLSKSSSNDSTSNQTSSIKSSTSSIINSYITTKTNSNTNVDNTGSHDLNATINNSVYSSDGSTTNFTTDSSSTTTTILHVRRGSNNNSHNQYDSPLITPAVTRTPNLPPMIPRRAYSSSTPHSSDIDVSREMGFKFPASTNAVNYSDFKPPTHQFEEQPPKLRSPLILNGGITPPLGPATRNIASELATVSIKDLANDDFEEFFPKPPHPGIQAVKISGQSPGQLRSWSNSFSRKNISNSSSNSLDSNDIRKLIIPEELQESNSLNAYKDGPRNVLNGQIYLYSDPFDSDSKVDINKFDLIVNVAKECKNMSLSYRNQVPGQREYVYVPWSHTSAISKDLQAITTKMEHFYSLGKRILVHCQCGVSRSACVVVAFFMSKFGLNVNEAYELLKMGTENISENVNRVIGEKGNRIDACDRICPNMSLIFELMEFGEILGQN